MINFSEMHILCVGVCVLEIRICALTLDTKPKYHENEDSSAWVTPTRLESSKDAKYEVNRPEDSFNSEEPPTRSLASGLLNFQCVIFFPGPVFMNVTPKDVWS